MDTDLPVRLLDTPVGDLYESARWLPQLRCFQWVEIFSGVLFRWCPDEDKVECRETGIPMVSLALLRPDGALLLAAGHRMYRYDWDTGARDEVRRLELPLDVRFNDGEFDSLGRLWIGTMTLGGVGRRGELYRVDVDGTLSRQLKGIGISNGLGWLTSTKAVYIDSTEPRLSQLDLDDDGSIGLRSTYADIPGPGEPDGLAVDASGGIHVAMWEGGCISSVVDGRVVRRNVPFRRPTSLALSDGIESICFVTSAKVESCASIVDGRVGWFDEDALSRL